MTTTTNAAEKRQLPFPRRYIFNDDDMHHFLESPAKASLLRFTAAMGRACATPPTSSKMPEYDPHRPLMGLSPAMACLHGSLRGIRDTWFKEIPPVQDRSNIRFGNPSFTKWHARLVERSHSIVHAILSQHDLYARHENNDKQQEDDDVMFDMEILEKASQVGYNAAVATPSSTDTTSSPSADKERVIQELSAYLQSSFGHPVRLDYGTGHECSFQVLLYSLVALGCATAAGTPPSSTATTTTTTTPRPPSIARLRCMTLSLWNAYLQVTRQVQTDYFLEPAGSHGVWGLDDYHCLPFYFGACQLQAATTGAAEDASELSSPSSIRQDPVLRRHGDIYLYYSCIRYIQTLKKGVPFFESSPMLNDISHLDSWSTVSKGLLKLFEGEVLQKRQVVQHFVFGDLFQANWTPSQDGTREAPAETFRSHNYNAAGGGVGAHGVGPVETRAPWAAATTTSNMPPTTRAPWASAGSGGSSAEGQGLPPPTRAPWAK